LKGGIRVAAVILSSPGRSENNADVSNVTVAGGTDRLSELSNSELWTETSQTVRKPTSTLSGHQLKAPDPTATRKFDLGCTPLKLANGKCNCRWAAPSLAFAAVALGHRGAWDQDGETSMTRKLTILACAAVLASGLASSAFAQTAGAATSGVTGVVSGLLGDVTGLLSGLGLGGIL
jgi:hypothetical protein